MWTLFVIVVIWRVAIQTNEFVLASEAIIALLAATALILGIFFYASLQFLRPPISKVNIPDD